MRIAALRISQHQQFDLMIQQQESDQYQQQQFEQQCQQQRDHRMTLDYLLTGSGIYELSPLELYEQRRQLNHQTQQIVSSEPSQSQNQQPVAYQSPQSELYVQSSPIYPPDSNQGMHQGLNQGTNQGMLPAYESLDPNFYCNLEALPNGEQTNYSWIDSGSANQDMDFKQCLENALRVELAGLQHDTDVQQPTVCLFDDIDFELGMGRVDSMAPEELHDPYPSSYPYIEAPATINGNMVGSYPVNAQGNFSDTTAQVLQAQREATAERAHKPHNKPAPFSIDEFFTGFNPLEDILRQPTSPKRDLTSEALAKHLISELGLAIRLSELHHRWNNNNMRKSSKWFTEVDLLGRLEERGSITPWGPLSDWLVMYQTGLETILDRYGHGAKLNWQMDRKVRADKIVLSKSLREDLRCEASKLIGSNMEALFKLLVELTGQTDLKKVKTALDEQLRLMKAAVAKDCATNGVLYLNVGPQGTYVEGEKVLLIWNEGAVRSKRSVA